jgi:hypothetical protein
VQLLPTSTCQSYHRRHTSMVTPQSSHPQQLSQCTASAAAHPHLLQQASASYMQNTLEGPKQQQSLRHHPTLLQLSPPTPEVLMLHACPLTCVHPNPQPRPPRCCWQTWSRTCAA